MISNVFDLAKLSGRENAILEAAIEGLTDIQISRRLEISQSTVNSYWVRIRGKLGQLSRTELVALVLKYRAQHERDEFNARLDELQTAAESHARNSENFGNADVFRAALDAMPEAVLAVCEKGLIRYVNSRLEKMFGYGYGEGEGELIDQPIGVLVPQAVREREGERIEAYMKDARPLRLGLDKVVYAQRRNGSQFRVALLIDSRPTATGRVFTCIVRDFTTEIDTRQQYASSWK